MTNPEFEWLEDYLDSRCHTAKSNQRADRKPPSSYPRTTPTGEFNTLESLELYRTISSVLLLFAYVLYLQLCLDIAEDLFLLFETTQRTLWFFFVVSGSRKLLALAKHSTFMKLLTAADTKEP
jgi:hypothetical protein